MIIFFFVILWSEWKSFKSVVFQYGHTKIFFRAGILGLMEEIRDDRINDLVSMMQVAFPLRIEYI